MKRITPINREKLLFRRQFILGPRFLNKFPSWRQAKIGRDIFLQTHPDLELTQIKRQKIELTLMGYLIDPDNPELDNQGILETMISQINTPQEVFKLTYRLGGRWILVLDDGKETIMFNDAAGLRQVFYTDFATKQNWFASQPGIIAEELRLAFDKKAEDDFMKSVYFKSEREYWWPGDSSPFKEIRHLLPNHYLDLRSGKCHRYWPDETLNNISLEEGIKKTSKMLRGLMRGAYNRFDLVLAISSGWDTRVILAASKEFHQKIIYLTAIYYDLTKDSPDIQIPSRLLSKLGLAHHVIKCPSTMNREFRNIYKRNVTTAHDSWGKINQGFYEHFPKDKMCVKGAISSEIVKPYLYDEIYELANIKDVNTFNASLLAQSYGMRGNPFAIRYFDRWLPEAREVVKKYNVNLIELFNWEQRTGNWMAMSLTEGDIVCETFTPYNCRELLWTFWSVDKKFRKSPEQKLYTGIINSLWKELLSEPINPIQTGYKHKAKVKLKALLVKTNTYEIVKELYYRMKIIYHNLIRNFNHFS